MTDPPDLSDLFEEPSLWHIYRKSKPFYRNRLNRNIALGVTIALAAYAVIDLRSPMLPHLDMQATFNSWASSGVSFASTILGFLLAGFAILFTIFKPDTVLALRQITREGERLDELKRTFVTFVDVFVHYTAFVFWCVVYTVAGGRNGPLDMGGRYLALLSPDIPNVVAHAVFVVWGVWFVVIVLKLKSFIYNLYQTLLLGMADSL